MTDSEKIDVIFKKVGKIEVHVAVQHERSEHLKEKTNLLEVKQNESEKEIKSIRNIINKTIGGALVISAVGGGVAGIIIAIIKIYLK